MTTTTHKIQLAFDAAGSEEETREYAEWLRAKGHDVVVGEYSSTYIDGECTSKCDEANRVANELWDGYCG